MLTINKIKKNFNERIKAELYLDMSNQFISMHGKSSIIAPPDPHTLRNYLIFQNRMSVGEYFSDKDLNSLLKKHYTENNLKLELVYISACESEIVAREFLDAGAEHIIAALKNES